MGNRLPLPVTVYLYSRKVPDSFEGEKDEQPTSLGAGSGSRRGEIGVRSEMSHKTYQELQHELAVLKSEVKRQALQKEVKTLRKQVKPSKITRFFHYAADGLYDLVSVVSCAIAVIIPVLKWLEGAGSEEDVES